MTTKGRMTMGGGALVDGRMATERKNDNAEGCGGGEMTEGAVLDYYI